jgi:conjugal transfer pilus assembly protein TraE
MTPERYFSDLELERRRNKRLMMFLGLALLVILVQSCQNLKNTGNEVARFIPPEIHKPFWVSANNASPEYFEQLGLYLISLTLNVTPENAQTLLNQQMQFVAPAQRDAVKKAGDAAIARLKRDNASTMFALQETRHDTSGRRVAFIGYLHTYIDGKQVSRTAKAYLLEFAAAEGRFYMIRNEEVNPNEPFAETAK